MGTSLPAPAGDPAGTARGLRILLVEDERTLAEPLAAALEDEGHRVTTVREGPAAMAWLERQRPDLVVTDVRLPGADGIAVLQRARAHDPPCEVLVMTGYATVEQAVEAMRAGAMNYLQKPFPTEALLGQVRRVAETLEMQRELRRLRAEGAGDADRFTGVSAAIHAVNERLRQVAGSAGTVLVTGESGTGKERAARILHRLGPAPEEPFVPIACSALPEGLVEGELFGYRQGAFTGADRDRTGLLEEAGAGTAYLDDVDDLPQEVQAKLLRVLQEHTVTPLGSGEERPFRARVVASTKTPLARLVEEGRFREDLYYRLHVVPVELPPLRERPEDVGPLLGAFLRRQDPEGRYRVPPEVLRKLALQRWPGNVRELENALQRALALSGRARVLRLEHFLPGGAAGPSAGEEEPATLGEATRRAEMRAIRAALAATGGRKLKAAERLGVSRKVLWSKMKELGMQDERGPTTEGA